MSRQSSLGGRRVAVALLLTFGPTVVLGYLAYRAVAERERSLRLGYTASAMLVRDRLAAELGHLTDALSNAIGEWPAGRTRDALQQRLGELTQVRPWLTDPFVVIPGGGVVTRDLSASWPLSADDGVPIPPAVADAVRQAEREEFVTARPDLALTHYRQALLLAGTPAARALALSRIGRTLVKLQRPKDALGSYEAILALPPGLLDAHGIPYAVIARMQIVDVFDAIGRAADRDQARITALRELLDHPWDADNGYPYYLRRAARFGDGVPPDLVRPLAVRLQSIATVEWIRERVVAPVTDRLAGQDHGRIGRALSVRRDAQAVVVAAYPLPAISQSETPAVLGVVLRLDYVADVLLPRAAAGVDLDTSARVALRAEDSAAGPAPLATVAVGDLLPALNIAVLDIHGRTIQQLTTRDRWLYGGLLGGVLVVLVVGVVFTTRAWAREAELSKLRTDFVSNVSHELKTPLALIRMFGETLESGLVSDPVKRQEFYGIIRRESERLTHLINNVLDTAQIEAGTKQFALDRADIVSLVREALDAYSALFSRLGVAVEAALPAEPVEVRMDRDAVAQALVNLFQNAIRHGGDGRHVAVAVRRLAGEVAISVADHGAGIAPADLPLIFDKFYRGAAAGAAGSGLGLSIVKHVMTAHGGRVDVDSAVGRGSTFTLVFPIERSAA